MILYGFRALASQINLLPSDIERLQKSDWDIICTFEEFQNLVKSFGGDILYAKPSFPTKYYIKTSKGNYDINIINNNTSSNYMIYESLNNNIFNPVKVDSFGNKMIVTPLSLLFLMKKSHLFIRRNFKKHIEDYYRMKDLLPEHSVNKYIEIYEKRLAETLERAKKQTAHINLKQSKDDFFNTKGVSYSIDHDEIHESMKIGDTPAYKRILAPNEEVMCSEELWNKLSYNEKLNCVVEEARVISIERYLHKGAEMSVYEAYCLALEKICTTLCKGYFRKFACMNYREALLKFTPDYYDKFKEDLESGKIRSYTKLDDRIFIDFI